MSPSRGNSQRSTQDSVGIIGEKEKDLLKAREMATKKAKDVDRKRQKHNLFSFIFIAIVSTIALGLYPSTATAAGVAVFICLFFCISISNQRQINRVIAVLATLFVVGLLLKYFVL